MTLEICDCRYQHGRQDGYRLIDEVTGAWGCGTCGRPMRTYVETLLDGS